MSEFVGIEWFHHYFGFQESVENVYKYIKIEKHEDHIEVISEANNKHYSAGLFNIRSPSYYSFLKPRGGGKFYVICGKDGSSIEDVLRQQNDENYDGATFQVASNFNCLEFPNERCTAARGISGYAIDGTQGPRATVAAPAALLYRNYFVEHDGCVGQIEKELNLLNKTPVRIVHGKSLCKKNEIDELSKFNFADEENYLAGVHENVEVSTNLSGKGRVDYKDAEPNRIVHQIYVAAFNYWSVARSHLTFEWGFYLLASEYKTTILAAWDHSIRYSGRKGSNKCVLNLIGGGCFANPFELICNAIMANEKVIIDSGLDVYLVCFNQLIFNQVYPLVSKLCERTGGGIIQA